MGQGSQFQGELELIALGLPQGVRLVSARVPASAMKWPVQFIADASVKPGCAAITIEARSVDTSKKLETITQQNIPIICHPGSDGWRVVRLDRFMLAVVDPLPFSIALKSPRTPLVRGGEVTIGSNVGFSGRTEFTPAQDRE